MPPTKVDLPATIFRFLVVLVFAAGWFCLLLRFLGFDLSSARDENVELFYVSLSADMWTGPAVWLSATLVAACDGWVRWRKLRAK